MEIGDNKVVTLDYVLTIEGDKIDESGDQPLTYLHGHRNMISGFEKNLLGLSKGANYSFDVSPEDGYGVYNNEAVMDLEKSIFLIDGSMSSQVYEGARLRLNDQNGNPFEGVVLEITDDKVKMDFNHPLAGQKLHFEGKIIDIREASEEEISHGHVHGPEGHAH